MRRNGSRVVRRISLRILGGGVVRKSLGRNGGKLCVDVGEGDWYHRDVREFSMIS